jgi:prolyl-tRNA synthetase
MAGKKASQASNAESTPIKEEKKQKQIKTEKKDESALEIPKIEEDFGEWFNEVIFRADIIDYRYNLKGCGVWLAYGFKLRRHVLQIIRDLLESTPIPHDEYLFPLLVPEPQFMKEAEHVKGFEDEVYWVTHGGLTPLDIKLALRPTSETVMYPMMALWIRSHQDLPLKTYQIVNTFRYEGKNTRPLIRVREITTFKEAHTCHATAADAENQIREAIGVYKAFFDRCAVPYIITCRPKWDTFPGADYTIAFDCIFPYKHRTLQIGTVHNLGTTFAKTFDIKFENPEGKQELVYQTCYGISERSIAAIIASHGDNNGLLLAPNIAPIQIVIVPIIFKEKEQEIKEAAQKIYEKLKQAGIRVQLDLRDINSGKKFYHWELRGVPLRLELGPKDIAKNQVVLVRRDNRQKTFISIDELAIQAKSMLDLIQEQILIKAQERHKTTIFRTNDLQEALEYVDGGKGVVEIPFCGKEDCAADIEKMGESLKFLGLPAEYMKELNPDASEEKEIYCVHCQNPVKYYWRLGRSY